MKNLWTKLFMIFIASIITLNLSAQDDENYNDLYFGEWSYRDNSLPDEFYRGKLKIYQTEDGVSVDLIAGMQTISSDSFAAHKSGARVSIFIDGEQIVLNIKRVEQNLQIYFSYDCQEYIIVGTPKKEVEEREGQTK